MRIREALSFGLLLLLVSCVTTAREEGEQLTLDMLHGAPGFDPEGFGPARWLEDGSGYTTLEATESEAPSATRSTTRRSSSIENPTAQEARNAEVAA